MKTRLFQRPSKASADKQRRRWWRRRQNNQSDSANILHHAIWPFLLIAQFMGVLPVSGLREKDVTRVHFRWIHIGVAVTIVLIAFGVLDLVLSLNIVVERGLKMYTAGPVTFSLTGLLSIIMFFRVARQWPALIRQYTRTERIFLDKTYETIDSQRYCYRLRRNGMMLLLGALVDHGLYMSSAIYNNSNQINKCKLNVNFWENLFNRERLHLFSVIKFEMWMIPFLMWLTISMTFAWNFIDIFLMFITSSLAVRFGQVNKRMQRFKYSSMTDDFWLRTRMDFMSLLELLQAVDENLSGLVLLSCANNLYFICFHVFQSFQSKEDIMNGAYFWYKLSFVLTRILITMLSAASINDTCNDILTTFYDIPIDFWGIELERFYEIVATDLISISGKGFYFITRRMIFAMAGTVMTYELVLFDQVKDVVDRADFCIVRRV